MRSVRRTLLLAFASLALSVPAVFAQGGNQIRSIRTVGENVEIELFNPDEFPVRDNILVLRIGTLESLRSRVPDGDLTRVIFIVRAADFDRAANGDPVWTQFGRGETSDRVNFGRLDKSRRDK